MKVLIKLFQKFAVGKAEPYGLALGAQPGKNVELPAARRAAHRPKLGWPSAGIFEKTPAR